MRTVRTKVYQFNELNEDAKQKAINNYLNTEREFFWMDENIESIKKGLDFYGYKLGNYSIDFSSANSSYTPLTTSHSEEVENLTGVRLWRYLQNNYSTYFCKYQNKYRNTLEGNFPFTGYCVDENFLDTIREFMKKPTNKTFTELMEECVYECLKAIEEDYEYQQSDEYIIDYFEGNEIEFTIDGNIF